MANFTISNDGERAVKDLEVMCSNYAPSGTLLDTNTRTIYEVVPAHSIRHFNAFNMGFIQSQTRSSGCQVTDLTLGTDEDEKKIKEDADRQARAASRQRAEERAQLEKAQKEEQREMEQMRKERREWAEEDERQHRIEASDTYHPSTTLVQH